MTTQTPAEKKLTPDQVNTYSTISLVLSLLWLGGVGSAIAVVLGHQALNSIEKNRDTDHGNRTMALAGVVLGWLGVAATAVPLVMFIFFFVVIGGLAAS